MGLGRSTSAPKIEKGTKALNPLHTCTDMIVRGALVEMGALPASVCSDVGDGPGRTDLTPLCELPRGPRLAACRAGAAGLHAGHPAAPGPSPHAPAPEHSGRPRSSEPEQQRSAEHDQNNPFFRSVSSARLASHLHFGDAESFETGKVAIVSLPLALSHTLWSHFQAQSRSGS